MHRRYHVRGQKAFTLIELLVVIAIIAILSVVVILTLNPAELLRQSRDSSRISDVATLNSALGIYAEDVGNALGSANTVYGSIADPTATSTAGDQCQGLGLLAVPATYTYHCAASSTKRAVNSTGWIPVNFKLISSGSPFGSLPVDPVNNSSSRLYYTYATNGTQFEVTSAMESAKYKFVGSNDVIGNDGGSLASVYEKGTKLGLEPLDYADPSLVGYWTMDEGTSTVAYDYSGNNNTGTWNGTQNGSMGYYSAGKIGSYAGSFDGTSDYILNDQTINAPLATISAWIYISAYPASIQRIVGFAQGNAGSLYDKDLLLDASGRISFYVFDGSGKTTSSSTNPISLNQWTHVVGTANGTNAIAYVNGIQVGSIAAGNTFAGYTGPNILIGGTAGGNSYFSGLIDDVRVYNRALSAPEVQAMYAGGK